MTLKIRTMNRIEKIVVGKSSLLMGIILSRFAISKLAGWEISVQAFIEMANPLGINPTFFRVFSGGLILIVFLSYLVSAFYTFFQYKVSLPSKLDYFKFSILTNLLGIFTMTGALLSEFYLRIQPKWPLVYIAIGIIIFSIINLWIIIRKEKKTTLIIH